MAVDLNQHSSLDPKVDAVVLVAKPDVHSLARFLRRARHILMWALPGDRDSPLGARGMPSHRSALPEFARRFPAAPVSHRWSSPVLDFVVAAAVFLFLVVLIFS
jgi:hypothetical protein